MIIARLLCDYCVIQLSCDRTNSLTPCKSTGKSSASFGIEREGLLRNPYSLLTASYASKTKNLLAQVNLDRQVSCFLCGKRGIRTPGPSQVNGFQDRRDRPLRHLSLLTDNKRNLRHFDLKSMQRYIIFLKNTNLCSVFLHICEKLCIFVKSFLNNH